MTKQQHLALRKDLEELKLNTLKLCNSLAHNIYNVNDPKIEERNLFKILLQRHDWLHEYSDDYGSYEQGKKEEMELYRMMKDNEEFIKLYNEANPFTKV